MIMFVSHVSLDKIFSRVKINGKLYKSLIKYVVSIIPFVDVFSKKIEIVICQGYLQ